MNTVQCRYDWNTGGVADGNYFIDVALRDWNAAVDYNSSSSIGLSTYVPNSIPDINIQRIDGYIDNNASYNLPVYFSYFNDGNLTITFTVKDLDRDDLNFNMWYSASAGAKTNKIVSDLNLTTKYCDSNDWTSTRQCRYDWNANPWQIADNNYFIDIVIRDSNNDTDANSSSTFKVTPCPRDTLTLSATTTLFGAVCADNVGVYDVGSDGVISVGADGITVDFNKLALDGSFIGQAVNNPGYDNVTLKNLMARDYNVGIWLNQAANSNKIMDSNITHSNFGIHILASTDANIWDNNVDKNNAYGLYFANDANRAWVKDNNISDNNSVGIYVVQAGDMNIYRNKINYNGSTANDAGLYLLGSSGDVNVVDNNAIGNNAYGLLSQGGRHNIADNNVLNNLVGILISGGLQQKIRDNNVSGNTNDGIQLDTGAKDLNIYDNNVSANGRYGIYANGAFDLNVYHNDINYNGSTGFYSATGNVDINLTKNIIRNNTTQDIYLNDTNIIFLDGNYGSIAFADINAKIDRRWYVDVNIASALTNTAVDGADLNIYRNLVGLELMWQGTSQSNGNAGRFEVTHFDQNSDSSAPFVHTLTFAAAKSGYDTNNYQKAVDANSNITVFLSLDISPVTTIRDFNWGWQNKATIIYMACANRSGSGCLATKYRRDTDATNVVSLSGWMDYNSDGIVFSTDGNWAIDFNSTDNSGNIEDTNRVYLRIDQTNPAVSITSPAAGSTTSSETVTITWSGSDATSGVLHYDLLIDGVVVLLQTGNASYTHTFSTLLSHTVTVNVADRAGNGASSTSTFSVVITGGTGSTATGGAGGGGGGGGGGGRRGEAKLNLNLGKPCSGPQLCGSGLCVGGICVECADNSKCGADEVCTQNMCVKVECECGYVEAQKCLPYECCANEDCAESYACNLLGHKCYHIVLPKLMMSVSHTEPVDGETFGVFVKDRNGTGVGGVFVSADGGMYTTDKYGTAAITLPIGEYTISASKEGYEPDAIKMAVKYRMVLKMPEGALQGELIEVEATDTAGKPLDEVELLVQFEDGSTRIIKTNEYGVAYLLAQKTGAIQIKARAAGYASIMGEMEIFGEKRPLAVAAEYVSYIIITLVAVVTAIIAAIKYITYRNSSGF